MNFRVSVGKTGVSVDGGINVLVGLEIGELVGTRVKVLVGMEVEIPVGKAVGVLAGVIVKNNGSPVINGKSRKDVLPSE